MVYKSKKEVCMRRFIVLGLALLLVFVLSPAVFATNGTNLIGVGAISRSMGGVGIAAPQDAISATFANPAAMCFGPYCPGSQIDFDATFFMPDIQAKITNNFTGRSSKEDAEDNVFPIPAFGLSTPITEKLRFGLSAYGVSGLGADYRDTGLFLPNVGPGNTDVPGEIKTELQVMKFSPNFAYLINDNFSIGLGIQVDYSTLDLGAGSSGGYGAGAKIGTIWKAHDMITIGATYTTPQKIKYKNVIDTDCPQGSPCFEPTGDEDLELESPQEVGVGIAYEPILGKLLIAVDGKWVNWSDAEGYDDFDWNDQYVIAVGVQFKPNKKLALRAGYNYGENPVDDHSGYDPTALVKVQDVVFPAANYEYLRIIGFPAIVEHHITAGIGYEVSNTFALNLGYMYALENDMDETDAFGAITLESKLSEQSVELGLTWRF